MEQKQQELIEKALNVYMRLGIKSVTMDEMARQLGVSKKTIYQFVKDKNDLVEKCVQYAKDTDVNCIKEIIEQNENAIDELVATSEFVSEELKQIHPSIFFDLARYHPKALKIFESHKDEFIKECVKQNLEKGIEQGLYRDNMNVDIIAFIYISTIDQMFAGDNRSINKIPTEQVHSEVFRYHIRGIASDKGRKYLKQKFNNK